VKAKLMVGYYNVTLKSVRARIRFCLRAAIMQVGEMKKKKDDGAWLENGEALDF
jgi:hypothetical protein